MSGSVPVPEAGSNILKHRLFLTSLLIFLTATFLLAVLNFYNNNEFIRIYRDYFVGAAASLTTASAVLFVLAFMINEQYITRTIINISQNACEGTIRSFQQALVNEISPQVKRQIESIVEGVAHESLQKGVTFLEETRKRLPVEFFPAYEAPSRRYQDFFNATMAVERGYRYFGDFGSFSSYEIAKNQWHFNRLNYFPLTFMFLLPDVSMFGTEKWRTHAQNIATTLYIFSSTRDAERMEVGFYRDERVYSFELFPGTIFLNLPSEISDSGEIFGDTFVYRNDSYFWRTFDNLFDRTRGASKRMNLYFEMKNYSKSSNFIEMIKEKLGLDIGISEIENLCDKRLEHHERVARARRV